MRLCDSPTLSGRRGHKGRTRLDRDGATHNEADAFSGRWHLMPVVRFRGTGNWGAGAAVSEPAGARARSTKPPCGASADRSTRIIRPGRPLLAVVGVL